MKKMIKNNIKVFISIIISGIIFGGIGVYAANQYNASQIEYKNTTVDKALDDLYTKANKAGTVCTFKDNTYGTKGNIGAKYECDPGDGTKRNFYILKVNSYTVDLIMEQNIAKGTMDWYSAIKYFNTNENGIAIKNAWNKVQNIDLPKAQDIADAVNKKNWIAGNNSDWWCLETGEKDQPDGPKYCLNETTNNDNLKTTWLWDYTRDCVNCEHSLDSDWAAGYWTRDLTSNSSTAWDVRGFGILSSGTMLTSVNRGVRPVITVLKSQLN